MYLQASAWNLTPLIATNGILLTHDPHQQSLSRSPRTWRGRPEDLHHQGPERTQSHDLRQSLSPVYSTQAWSEVTNGVAGAQMSWWPCSLCSVTTLLSIWRQQPPGPGPCTTLFILSNHPRWQALCLRCPMSTKQLLLSWQLLMLQPSPASPLQPCLPPLCLLIQRCQGEWAGGGGGCLVCTLHVIHAPLLLAMGLFSVHKNILLVRL